MKYFAIIFLLTTQAVWGETLTSDNFTIRVDRGCGEGVVVCDKIHFTVNATGFESKQMFIGTSMHSTCADGETPCAFQGYSFKSKDAHYILYSSGVLQVVDHAGNPLLLEQGKWKY